jgi:ABC-type multidrug transport system permease subunit
MSATMLVWRILPVSMRATHRSLRLIERSITVYRRTPMVLVSGFFEPLFYLFSIRVGFGALVGDIEFAGRTIGYAEFVAPAITMPMFLFSATFYPLSSYGSWGWIVQISPLYHGASLVRMASLGDASWGIVVHVAYLAVLSVGGLTVASRRIDSLLMK